MMVIIKKIRVGLTRNCALVFDLILNYCFVLKPQDVCLMLPLHLQRSLRERKGEMIRQFAEAGTLKLGEESLFNLVGTS